MTSDYTDDLDDDRREADAALTRPDPTTTDAKRDPRGGQAVRLFKDIFREDGEDPRRPAG